MCTFLESSFIDCTVDGLKSCVSEMMKGWDPASNTLWIFPLSMGTAHKQLWEMLSTGHPAHRSSNGKDFRACMICISTKSMNQDNRTYQLTEAECCACAGLQPELGPQQSLCSCCCWYKMELYNPWSEPILSFPGNPSPYWQWPVAGFCFPLHTGRNKDISYSVKLKHSRGT